MEKQQSQLFEDKQSIDVINRDGLVQYENQFMSEAEANRMFEYLKHKLDWQTRKILIFGKWIKQRRLIAFLGKTAIQYNYSSDTLTAIPWGKDIESLAEKLSRLHNYSYNVVLINYYRSGQDSMGWHADNEVELGRHPTIASLSLGQPRKFKLRHHDGEQHQLILEHGSLLTMTGQCQQYWKHALPKTGTDGGRINLTFRKIIE